MRRKVIIQKVDMDTALTAYLLEVSRNDDIIVVRDKASPDDLSNPKVICIECGGSGQPKVNNFDHHDTDQELPPACVQAFHLCSESGGDEALKQLVKYVRLLDTQGPEALKQRSRLPQGAFPTLRTKSDVSVEDINGKFSPAPLVREKYDPHSSKEPWELVLPTVWELLLYVYQKTSRSKRDKKITNPYEKIHSYIKEKLVG